VRGQLGRIGGHHGAGFVQADRAENGARSKVAIAAVDHFGADDVNRHIGGAQTASATEPTSSLPMGPGECVPITMRSIWRSCAKARISSAGSPAAPQPRNAGQLRGPLAPEAPDAAFHPAQPRVVVVTDGGGLRRGHGQCVIDVEEDEIRTKLLGLCQSECESLLVGRISAAKRMVEGLLQPDFNKAAIRTSFQAFK